MRTAAVLGWPIGHSRSPAIMNAAFAACGIDAEMIALAVPPAQLEAEVVRLRALPMLGASVTIPHKLAVAAACDELSPAAVAIGAVNCLALDPRGTLIGHNTDASGFVDSLGESLRAARVVVLGAGGAARAIAYGATQAGARVDVVARGPAGVTWIAAHAWTELPELFAQADVVVDCTPAALDPATDATFTDSLPLDALRRAARVITLVYHRRSNLIERAAARGHSTLGGGPMLVHQAARAFTLWTGAAAPIDVMTQALGAPA